MVGYFKNGVWHDGGLTFESADYLIRIETPQDKSIQRQVDRVAKMLDLTPCRQEDIKGEIIINGVGENWYKVFDIIEEFLKKVN